MPPSDGSGSGTPEAEQPEIGLRQQKGRRGHQKLRERQRQQVGQDLDRRDAPSRTARRRAPAA